MWKLYGVKWVNGYFPKSVEMKWAYDINGKLVAIKARTKKEALDKAVKMYFTTGLLIDVEEIKS